jgi:transcriptional regulator with XRE-family HTH domain
MPTGKQIRAARMLTGWEAETLAGLAKISRNALLQIERGEFRPRPTTLEKIVNVFDAAGIEFIENEGICRKLEDIEIFKGPERFEAFYDFLYEHLKTYGGDVCVSVTDERLFAKYRKDSTIHYKRMQELYDRGVIKSFRILANQSNFSAKYPYNKYKWQPKASVAPTAFFTFTGCLALISFVHETPPYVVVLQSAPLASSYQEAFNAAWETAEDPPKAKPAKA